MRTTAAACCGIGEVAPIETGRNWTARSRRTVIVAARMPLFKLYYPQTARVEYFNYKYGQSIRLVLSFFTKRLTAGYFLLNLLKLFEVLPFDLVPVFFVHHCGGGIGRDFKDFVNTS